MTQLSQDDVFDSLPENDLTSLFRQTADHPLREVREILETVRPSEQFARGRSLYQWRWATTLVTSLMLVVVVSFWREGVPKPLLAQGASEFLNAKSVRCQIQEISGLATEPPALANRKTNEGTLYWAKPGSYRYRMTGDEVDYDMICLTNKTGLTIDHRNKTYVINPAVQGNLPPMISIFERIANSPQKAETDLGETEIDGQPAVGFEVDLSQINPDAATSGGIVRAWLDKRTKHLVRFELNQSLNNVDTKITFDRFVWNESPDDWFPVKAPEGYANKTQVPPELEQITSEIVFSLETFAKYNNGDYPKVKILYGDVTANVLAKRNGADAILKSVFKPGRELDEEAKELLMKPEYKEYRQAIQGFARINVLERENPDAAYHGLNVSSKDADKILFRWRLESGEYQVIFGDLSHRRMMKEELRSLEAK